MRKGQIYSDEFKETIVEIVLNSSKSISELSIELGLSDRTLYNWTYIERLTKSIGFMNLDQERKLKEEVNRIRKELKHAKKEINILSKIVSNKFYK